jgi:hypothetical protein
MTTRRRALPAARLPQTPAGTAENAQSNNQTIKDAPNRIWPEAPALIVPLAAVDSVADPGGNQESCKSR